MNSLLTTTVLLAGICAAATLLSGCATRADAEPADPDRDAILQAPVPSSQVLQALPEPASPQVGADETVVGRYTTVIAAPTEADTNPLAVVVRVHFPRGVVNTVGDAVRYLLIRTGYQLVDESTMDARVRAVFALRLPDSQRVMGPWRVDAMLGALMGKPYQVVSDPSTRSITYVVPATPAPPTSPAANTGPAAAAAGPASMAFR